MHRARRLLLLLPLAASACLVPAQGTPVHVDMRAGSFWSGQGQLLEVSSDERHCRVAIRENTLFVREHWVSCDHVHPRNSRDHF